MKLVYILIILGLSSCGSKSDSDDSGPAPVKGVDGAPPVSTSYYVNTASALIACTDQTRGFLAYIKDSSQFEACLDSGWTVVDIKGKDGSNGKDGAPVSPNQWYDAVTQKMWVMTTIISTIASYTNACTDNYRTPSGSEIQTALTHGMKAAAQAMVNPPTFILASDGTPYTVNAGTQGSASSAAQFCIAK